MQATSSICSPARRRCATSRGAFARANDRAHGVQLAAYRDAVGEVVVDGVVTSRDLRPLERLRADLGLADAEHATIVAELSEEQRDLLGPGRATSVERGLQLEGYRAALAAVYTGAPGEDLAAAAHAFGVDEAVHRSAPRAGDVVGEIAALDRSPRTATVTATGGSVSVLRLGRDDLRAILRSHPEIADAVLATLARRLRASTGDGLADRRGAIEERLTDEARG